MKWNTEIERKFLVRNPLPLLLKGNKIIQSYLFISKNKELRVRLSGGKGTLTIKIKIDKNKREEINFQLSEAEAIKLININSNKFPIEKNRYLIFYEGMNWEIDVFEGKNKNLILAEIELNFPEQEISLPPWIGKEVTEDARYYNQYLFNHPFSKWEK